MHAINEERLLRILGILKLIDRGSSDQNRRTLLEVRDDGARIVDLVSRGLFGEAAAALGVVADGLPAVADPKLRPLEQGRRPPAPADLLDAMHDPVHVEPPLSQKARFRRLGRGK